MEKPITSPFTGTIESICWQASDGVRRVGEKLLEIKTDGTEVSSRYATCGQPSDTDMIRRAIEAYPPETAMRKATQVLVIALCTAFGPLLLPLLLSKSEIEFLREILRRDAAKELFGLVIGFCLGVIVQCLFVNRVAKCIRNLRNRDGYHVLDKIIKMAANGRYGYRRMSPNRDVACLLIYVLGAFVIEHAIQSLYHALFPERPSSAKAFRTALGRGTILWLVLHDVNMLGVWTGRYFSKQGQQRSMRCLLFVLTAFPELLLKLLPVLLERYPENMNKILVHLHLKQMLTEAGDDLIDAPRGVLCLLIGMTWISKPGKHRIAMIVSFLVMLRAFHSKAWREVFLLTMAWSAYLVVPSFSRQWRVRAVLAVLVAPASALLLVLYPTNP